MATKIGEVIDRERLGGLQVLVLVLTSLAIIIDGFDIQAIAFAGPVILKEWGLSKAQLGPAIAAALIGMAIGGPFGGALGDKFGRRLTIILSALFFGAATIATAFSPNLTALIVLRFVSGLGFGALLPNATALLAEWMPTRYRAPAIGLMIIGVPIGGMIGAAVAQWLIPAYGWRACFLVGGALGVGLAGVLAIGLPESLRFLLRREGASPAVMRLVASAFGQSRVPADLSPDDEPRKPHWSEVMTPEHLRVTIGLSIAFFANLAVAYAFFNWVPTMLTSMGMPLEVALRGALYFNLWGLFGALAGAVLINWLGSRVGLLLVLGGAIVVAVVMGYTINAGVPSAGAMIIGLSAAGTFISGLQACLYALAAAAYPTTCRSAGIGVVAGIGRLGSIASAFLGGAILSLQAGQAVFFVVVAAVLVLAVVGVLVVNRHAPPARRAVVTG
jgi:AAHS family 4-hydroxybenzoate transporter-like MFS transporter